VSDTTHFLHKRGEDEKGQVIEWEAHVTLKSANNKNQVVSLGTFPTKLKAINAVERYRKRIASNDVETALTKDEKISESLRKTSLLLTSSGTRISDFGVQEVMIANSDKSRNKLSKRTKNNGHHEVHSHVTSEEFAHVEWEVIYQYLPVGNETVYKRRLKRDAIDRKWGSGAKDGIVSFLCYKWFGCLASCPAEISCCWRKSAWVLKTSLNTATNSK
jgi:hypothetical protein